MIGYHGQFISRVMDLLVYFTHNNIVCKIHI